MRNFAVYHGKLLAVPDLVQQELQLAHHDEGLDVVVSHNRQYGSVQEVLLHEDVLNLVELDVPNDCFPQCFQLPPVDFAFKIENVEICK